MKPNDALLYIVWSSQNGGCLGFLPSTVAARTPSPSLKDMVAKKMKEGRSGTPVHQEGMCVFFLLIHPGKFTFWGLEDDFPFQFSFQNNSKSPMFVFRMCFLFAPALSQFFPLFRRRLAQMHWTEAFSKAIAKANEVRTVVFRQKLPGFNRVWV